MGDNQRSRGVVIARNRSLGALDHQRRDLHSIKLSYLTEDRAVSSINFALSGIGTEGASGGFIGERYAKVVLGVRSGGDGAGATR